MPKRIIRTEAAPLNPAYSQAVVSNGLVFVSGQGPFDPKTGEVVGGSIGEQTAQALRNVEAILKAAGSSLDKAVSATFILAEESDFGGFNERAVQRRRLCRERECGQCDDRCYALWERRRAGDDQLHDQQRYRRNSY